MKLSLLSLLSNVALSNLFNYLLVQSFAWIVVDLQTLSGIQFPLGPGSSIWVVSRRDGLLVTIHGWYGCGAIGSGVHSDDTFVQGWY